MVTTAVLIAKEVVRERPVSYKLLLWCIPFFSGLILITIFLLADQSGRVNLISSNNSILLEKVQLYLETESIPFVKKGNAILIDPGDKSWILSELAKQDWFQAGAGLNRNGNNPISQAGMLSERSGQIVWQQEESTVSQ